MISDQVNLKEPFIDSLLFDEKLLDATNSEFIENAIKLNRDGYCIIDLKLSEEEIENANEDIDNAVKNKSFKTNSSAYHYNESPRIVEAWKFSNSIKVE